MNFNIKRIRKSRKMSLKKLSELSGISVGYLSDLENGKEKNPTINTLQKIAAALNTSVSKLLNEDL